MSEIRNKIITISGDPGSGKSTVTNALKAKYESMGYNVHVIKTGQIFRELATKEYTKMYPDRKDANLADIQNDPGFAEKRNLIDKMVDDEIRRKGIEINEKERPEDVYIVDSRLAWKNIPVSYKVKMTLNEEEAGRRAYKDSSRGPEDKYLTIEDAIKKTTLRKNVEIERYKQDYGIDLSDLNNYDLVVDTLFTLPEDTVDVIITGEEKYRKGERFPKYWRNPATFVPSQKIGETLSKSPCGFTVEEIAESIKENGFSYNSPKLDAIIKNGVTVLKDGHHRCIGAVNAGKNLIPYNVTNIDDEVAEKYFAGNVSLSGVYDWEDIVRYYANEKNKFNLSRFDMNRVVSMKKLDGLVKELKAKSEEGR